MLFALPSAPVGVNDILLRPSWNSVLLPVLKQHGGGGVPGDRHGGGGLVSVWYLAHPGPFLLLLLFITFSELVANPKNLLYTVANPARGLLNKEKRKSGSAPPPPPPPLHAARSEEI